jgi:NAD(P)-dependent dehydrogenase (short-subunit alcohol dehydrogenase family)
LTAKPIVLVTGGNRGIGLAIVERFAEEGYPVILASRDPVLGAAEAERLRKSDRDVTTIALDVSKAESIDAALAGFAKRGTEVGVLVNNAGMLPDGALMDMPWGDIAESFAVHVFGPLRLVRGLAPAMAERGFGRIVNLSSGWGSFAEGLDGPGAYGVTKAALNALTVRLAKDLPATVKINAMCPGWVRTRMGGSSATVSPEQAADTAFWLATLPASGPSGGFFRDRKRIKW